MDTISGRVDTVLGRHRAPAAHSPIRWTSLLGWLVFVLGGVPLLVAWTTPLQDWPNHVAGAHVLAALLDGSPFWSRFYRFNTMLVPNAGVDLGLLALRGLGLPEALAANLFLIATYALFVGGMTLLSRSLRAFDPTKVGLAVLLFYGAATFWGLVNYVLAVGLMWGLLGLWLATDRPWRRLGIAALGAIVLLFVHVIPAVVFPLLLACFDAPRWRAGARWSCASAPVALAVVVVLLRTLPGNTGHDLVAVYTGAGSIGAFASWKLRVFATTPFGGSTLQDGATLLAWIGVLATLFWAARPRLPLGAALGVLALVGLTLLAPERLGTGSLLDSRLAVLPMMLCAASIRLRFSVRAATWATACIALLVMARTVVIALEWRRAGTVFAEYDARAASLPPGSVMMMAYATPLGSLTWTDIWSPPIQSIAAQVVAHDIFFPALFANPDQQPIAIRAAFAAMGQPYDMTDTAHRRASLAALAPICASRSYAGVFLTELYGDAPFRIVDACAPGD